MQIESLRIGDWIETSYQSNPIRQVTPEMLNMTQDEADRWKPIRISEALLKANKFRLKSESEEDGIHIKHYRRALQKVYNINIYVRTTKDNLNDYILSFNRRGIRNHRYTGNVDYVHELQHLLSDCDLTQLADTIKVFTPKTPKNND